MEDIMKIDDPRFRSDSLGNVGKSDAGNNVNSRTKSAGTTDSAASGDRVDLNSLTRLFAQAQTAGESARAARIEQLRQLFATSHNTADSQELSGAIIDAHLVGG